VRYAFESEPITAGLRCNCSICQRRGTVMSVPYFENVEITGMDALAPYVWGDMMVRSYFCRTCGIYTFHEVIAEPGKLRINLGCVDGVEPLELPYRLVDGRSY
jgi:hypothetical protein